MAKSRIGKLAQVAAFALWLLPWGGCHESTSSDATLPDAKMMALQGPTAKQLLENLLARYRRAKSYSDNATLVEYSVSRARGVPHELPYRQLSLAFVRPNKLSLTYEDLVGDPEQRANYRVASNGTIVRSSAAEVADQIHEAPAPLELTISNCIAEPALRDELFAVSVENLFPQLAMLLADSDQPTIFPAKNAPRRLTDESVDGIPYFRIVFHSAAGKRILWIDQNDFSLRRMEVPIDRQRESLDPGNQFSQLSIWIDFLDVTFDAEIVPEVFQHPVPEDARRVSRFVPPLESSPESEAYEEDRKKYQAALDAVTIQEVTIQEPGE